jgi:hypothetical protein
MTKMKQPVVLDKEWTPSSGKIQSHKDLQHVNSLMAGISNKCCDKFQN